MNKSNEKETAFMKGFMLGTQAGKSNCVVDYGFGEAGFGIHVYKYSDQRRSNPEYKTIMFIRDAEK